MKITARKMRRIAPDKPIRLLKAFFPYRGDKLPHTTFVNLSAGRAADEMEFAQKNTGYYLTWEVSWAEVSE